MSTPKQPISLTTAVASSIGALMFLWIMLALLFGLHTSGNGGTTVRVDAAVQQQSLEDVSMPTMLRDGATPTADASSAEVRTPDTAVSVEARTVIFYADAGSTYGDDNDDVPPEERGCSH